MSIQSINAEILAGNFTNEQLTSIGDAIKFARARITEKSIRTLRLGTSVRFTSNKNGMTYSGTVDKIAIKYVTVRTQQGLWKVPASMLEAV
jgi:hypothetical protein